MEQYQLTKEGIEHAVGRIALMPFFPSSDPTARACVAHELVSMCECDAQALWLSYRADQVFTHGWPGLGELRALFCKQFKPKDKIELYSQVYERGFPTEEELGPLAIPGLKEFQEYKRLEAGRAPLQIEAPGQQMTPEELQEFHAETIGEVMKSKRQEIRPTYREVLEAERLGAILDDDADKAMRLTRQLREIRSGEQRRELRAIERQIAQAQPTLTAEEKARRIMAIEVALHQKPHKA